MKYFVLGEFDSSEEVLEAVRKLRDKGHKHLDAFTPFPVPGMREALGMSRSWIRYVTFAAGLFGACFGYWLQWVVSAVQYPYNVGNRPPHAYPSFIPIAYENLILFSAVATFFALIVAARLPRLNHPALRAPHITNATLGNFWVGVPAETEHARDVAKERLESLAATRVTVVEKEVGE